VRHEWCRHEIPPSSCSGSGSDPPASHARRWRCWLLLAGLGVMANPCSSWPAPAPRRPRWPRRVILSLIAAVLAVSWPVGRGTRAVRDRVAVVAGLPLLLFAGRSTIGHVAFELGLMAVVAVLWWLRPAGAAAGSIERSSRSRRSLSAPEHPGRGRDPIRAGRDGQAHDPEGFPFLMLVGGGGTWRGARCWPEPVWRFRW